MDYAIFRLMMKYIQHVQHVNFRLFGYICRQIRLNLKMIWKYLTCTGKSLHILVIHICMKVVKKPSILFGLKSGLCLCLQTKFS